MPESTRNPMPESTLSPCQGLRIWPQKGVTRKGTRDATSGSHTESYPLPARQTLYILGEGGCIAKGGGGRKASNFSGQNISIIDKETYHGIDYAALPWRWGQMKWLSVPWGKTYFVLDRLEQLRQDINLLYRNEVASKPTKEWPLSYWVSIFPSFNLRQGPPFLIYNLLGRCSWVFKVYLYS